MSWCAGSFLRVVVGIVSSAFPRESMDRSWCRFDATIWCNADAAAGICKSREANICVASLPGGRWGHCEDRCASGRRVRGDYPVGARGLQRVGVRVVGTHPLNVLLLRRSAIDGHSSTPCAIIFPHKWMQGFAGCALSFQCTRLVQIPNRPEIEYFGGQEGRPNLGLVLGCINTDIFKWI